MSKAPAAQHAFDAVAPVQDCTRRNRFHHHRSSLPRCFCLIIVWAMGHVRTMTLHHIPTMLAYLLSALYTKMGRHVIGWFPSVLFYCSQEVVRCRCVGEGETRACDRKAQSFCLHTRRY